MENTLLTEIMVLREKNAELLDALKEVVINNKAHGSTGAALIKQIESLINSNITE